MDAAIDVSLPSHALSDATAFVETAERAEQLDYERAWLPETWGRDAVSLLATMAARTEEIGLGSSILNVYSRSPALLGQTAATLQELSEGRFRLGVGPSGPIVIENWHGREYGNPLRHTREAVEIIKAVLSGEPVDYDGDYSQLSEFRLRCDPPDPRPAVDAAAMGPTAVELAGRFADGWHATKFTIDGMSERLADFERGAELGGRDTDDLRVTAAVPACVLDDAERARDLARGHIAFYVAAMGDFYRESLAEQGHPETARQITELWHEGDRAGARAAIDDDLLDAMAAAGTAEQARDRLAAWTAIDGVDAVTVTFPRGTDREEMASTMDALAP
ncbi:MAG: TIGR04024 family LLM class F420-dependent oxidoreductase [Salinirussus sp.]